MIFFEKELVSILNDSVYRKNVLLFLKSVVNRCTLADEGFLKYRGYKEIYNNLKARIEEVFDTYQNDTEYVQRWKEFLEANIDEGEKDADRLPDIQKKFCDNFFAAYSFIDLYCDMCNDTLTDEEKTPTYDKNRKYTEETKKLKEKIEALNKEKEQLKKEREQAEKERKAVENRLNNLRNEMVKKKPQTSENSELRKKYDALFSERQELKEENDVLKRKCLKLERDQKKLHEQPSADKGMSNREAEQLNEALYGLHEINETIMRKLPNNTDSRDTEAKTSVNKSAALAVNSNSIPDKNENASTKPKDKGKASDAPQLGANETDEINRILASGEKLLSERYKRVNAGCVTGSLYVEISEEPPYLCYMTETDEKNVFRLYPTASGIENVDYMTTLFSIDELGVSYPYVKKPAVVVKNSYDYQLKERGIIVK